MKSSKEKEDVTIISISVLIMTTKIYTANTDKIKV